MSRSPCGRQPVVPPDGPRSLPTAQVWLASVGIRHREWLLLLSCSCSMPSLLPRLDFSRRITRTTPIGNANSNLYVNGNPEGKRQSGDVTGRFTQYSTRNEEAVALYIEGIDGWDIFLHSDGTWTLS